MKTPIYFLFLISLCNLGYSQPNCDNLITQFNCPTIDEIICFENPNMDPISFPRFEYQFEYSHNIIEGDNPNEFINISEVDSLGCIDTFYSSFIDEVIAECTLGYKVILERSWTVTLDAEIYNCTQTVNVLPALFTDIDSFPPILFECIDDIDSLDHNGNPHPDISGYPRLTNGAPADICNNLLYGYTDLDLPICGNSKKIIRDWTITDWCSDDVYHKEQVISIEDHSPPSVINKIDTIHVDIHDKFCWITPVDLPLPEIEDCNEVVLNEIRYEKILPDGTRVWESNGTSLTLPRIDFYLCELFINVQYVFIDVCDNTLICEAVIIGEDKSAPFPICRPAINVSIGSDGKAVVPVGAILISDLDNCGTESVCIEKLNGSCFMDFGCADFLKVCCAEIGQTIQARVTVTDKFGNVNWCVTDINVEDKMPPMIECPEDLVISCSFEISLDSLSVFGDPEFSDNCSDSLNIQYQITDNRDMCNLGMITRTWTVMDQYGNLSESCTQTINIVEDPDATLEITWPRDTTFVGCLDSLVFYDLGEPMLNDGPCHKIAVRVEDQIFFLEDQCKIIRTWGIMDWCDSTTYIQPQTIIIEKGAGAQITCDTLLTINLDSSLVFRFEEQLIPDNCGENLIKLYSPESYNCDDLGTSFITTYFRNENGTLVDSCLVEISITDDNGLCPCVDSLSLYINPFITQHREARYKIESNGIGFIAEDILYDAPTVELFPTFEIRLGTVFETRHVGCDPDSICDVSAGNINLEDGSTNITICVNDGISDAIAVNLSGGNYEGETWIVTDTIGNILAIQNANVFEFETAGLGVCLIYNIGVSGDLIGLFVGNQINNITGCFAFSNPITVERVLKCDLPECNTDEDCLNNSIVCMDVTLEINENQMVEVDANSIADIIGCNAILSFSDTNIISNIIFDCQDIGILSIPVYLFDLYINCDGTQDTVYNNIFCNSQFTVNDSSDFCTTGGAVSEQDKIQNLPSNN